MWTKVGKSGRKDVQKGHSAAVIIHIHKVYENKGRIQAWQPQSVGPPLLGP
jgi:hypothetical protein